MPRHWASSKLLIGLLLAWSWGSAVAQVDLVEDGADLMSAGQRARIVEHHAYLLQDHDIDFRVVTASGTGDINRFAAERFAAIGVGGTSRTARGLLLVIAPDEGLVRLEVGHSLEGAYPDAFIAYIEQRQMVPFFRAGRIADGILATTELIITRAQRAMANAAFEGEDWYAGSGGGGATTTAEFDAAVTPPVGGNRTTERTGAALPGRQPSETLAAYFAAMQDRNADPALPLYTPATRQMLASWVMTPAQMDNLVETYRSCTPEPALYEGLYAVIRYPIAERHCAPFFFERIDGTWELDLTMMQRAIRFGRNNEWHFSSDSDHPYAFAFADWRLDRNGFPTATE